MSNDEQQHPTTESDDTPPKNEGAQEPEGSAAQRRRALEPRKPLRRTISREERRQRSQAKRSRRRRIYMAGGMIVALALIAGLALPSIGLGTTGDLPVSERELAGTLVDEQPHEIIEPGADADYSTSPPTSGPSYDEPVAWGIYTEQIADESIVRNLQYGAIVFNHSLTREEDIADLHGYAEALFGFPACYVIHPYSGIPEGDVTLTAWNWTDTMELEDKAAMGAFVNDHRNRAPLFIDQQCGAYADSEETVEATPTASATEAPSATEAAPTAEATPTEEAAPAAEAAPVETATPSGTQ